LIKKVGEEREKRKENKTKNMTVARRMLIVLKFTWLLLS